MEKLVMRDDPSSLGAEAFRTLKINLDFFNVDNNLKTLAITSSSPGEGKSTAIANLAIAFAQSGKRVILIDCDLRRPSVHKKFKISNTHGITDMIVDTDLKHDYIHTSKIDNLFILPCGTKPPNPAELLGSEKMDMLLEKLKGMCDIVLLDIPPILSVADSRIICGKVDGVILLCAYGQSEKDLILKSKQELDKVNAKLIGTILAKVPESQSHYSYYYDDNYNASNRKKNKRHSR